MFFIHNITTSHRSPTPHSIPLTRKEKIMLVTCKFGQNDYRQSSCYYCLSTKHRNHKKSKSQPSRANQEREETVVLWLSYRCQCLISPASPQPSFFISYTGAQIYLQMLWYCRLDYRCLKMRPPTMIVVMETNMKQVFNSYPRLLQKRRLYVCVSECASEWVSELCSWVSRLKGKEEFCMKKGEGHDICEHMRTHHMYACMHVQWAPTVLEIQLPIYK